MPWEAMGSDGTGSGGHGRQREAKGGHGFGNFWVGNYHWDRLGRPWEATGGHGRPLEAMEITSGVGTTHGRPR